MIFRSMIARFYLERQKAGVLTFTRINPRPTLDKLLLSLNGERDEYKCSTKVSPHGKSSICPNKAHLPND